LIFRRSERIANLHSAMPIDQILADLPNLPPEDRQRLLDTVATDQAAKLMSEPILAALPKLTPEDKKKLSHALADEITSEQKLAINEHVAQVVSKWAEWLGKLAAAIGIASILALASSLIYVFFILPDKAITQAENSIERRLGDLLGDRVKRIDDAVSDILVKYGNAQASYNNLTKRGDAISEDLEKRASDLDAKFKNLEQGPTSDAAKLVKAVQENAIGTSVVSEVAALKNDFADLRSGRANPPVIVSSLANGTITATEPNRLVDYTGLSLTIETSGVSVLIGIIWGWVAGNTKANQEVSAFYHIYRDGADIAKTQVSNGTSYFRIPMSFLYID
jgi:hypothetical protein